MKIDLNNQSYQQIFSRLSYCSGCSLLSPYTMHLSKCDISMFKRNFCRCPHYIFDDCNTSIFKI